jgi:hypothetical protein
VHAEEAQHPFARIPVHDNARSDVILSGVY